MVYIPHENLSLKWVDPDNLLLSLPWVSMEIEVQECDKAWINDAINHLKSTPSNQNVQKFIQELKAYPIYYREPRPISDFSLKDLQPCPDIFVDTTTPQSLISTFNCNISRDLLHELQPWWTWDWNKILNKAIIPGTDLYDPVTLVSYLICYRLEWESTSWSGQNGFGHFLENLLRKNEEQFFKAIGWITKQSLIITTDSACSMAPALIHFEKGREPLNHFINDEVGHYKFMLQVFADLGLNKDDFPVGSATQWMLDAHKRVAEISPLAFSAMINLFEAAYYEGEDPLSRVVKMSSKPQAAQGYELHYKINQEHRHCDMPIRLAKHLAPQSHAHASMTLGLFELTLGFLDSMEMRYCKEYSATPRR
jgi:hypothetical protein